MARWVTSLYHALLGLKNKSWFSSAPFYEKKSHAPHQILSLGKHVKCFHFSDDMVFSLALINFQFLSDVNQDIYFSISIKEKKKENRSPSSFFFFLSDENQDIYFSWLYTGTRQSEYLYLYHALLYWNLAKWVSDLYHALFYWNITKWVSDLYHALFYWNIAKWVSDLYHVLLYWNLAKWVSDLYHTLLYWNMAKWVTNQYKVLLPSGWSFIYRRFCTVFVLYCC